jgi:transcriptional regulator with XRE-family HTH domain
MKPTILEQFGNRIRELRLSKKWSQGDLGNETGFHKNYIGMVERGERNISLKNIEVFANTFGLSISKLLDL